MASRGYSPVAVPWLLIAVASLVTQYGLQSAWAGSAVVAHGLNCPLAYEILFPSQDRAHVPCIGRWIPNHRITREVPGCSCRNIFGRIFCPGLCKTISIPRLLFVLSSGALFHLIWDVFAFCYCCMSLILILLIYLYLFSVLLAKIQGREILTSYLGNSLL